LCGPTKKLFAYNTQKRREGERERGESKCLQRKKERKTTEKKTVQSIIQKDHEGRKGSMRKKGRELGL